MERERMFREQDDFLSTAAACGGNPFPARNYGQESEASDKDLKESLNMLGQMFKPCDVVNRGAQ
jgi:hypothetical protein